MPEASQRPAVGFVEPSDVEGAKGAVLAMLGRGGRDRSGSRVRDEATGAGADLRRASRYYESAVGLAKKGRKPRVVKPTRSRMCSVDK